MHLIYQICMIFIFKFFELFRSTQIYIAHINFISINFRRCGLRCCMMNDAVASPPSDETVHNSPFQAKQISLPSGDKSGSAASLIAFFCANAEHVKKQKNIKNFISLPTKFSFKKPKF